LELETAENVVAEERGVAVALFVGTNSFATNVNLNVFAESALAFSAVPVVAAGAVPAFGASEGGVAGGAVAVAESGAAGAAGAALGEGTAQERCG
jgi:hypothetical protein